MANNRYRPGAGKTPLRRDGQGRPLCRWCHSPVPPPKQTFCSPECVHEWRLRTDGSYLREQVFKRDLGVCAQCAADTGTMAQALRVARLTSESAHRALVKEFGLTPAEAEKTLWQADHIVPVADGGGQCGLEGLRTLCWRCHKVVTKAWRAERKVVPPVSATATPTAKKTPSAPKTPKTPKTPKAAKAPKAAKPTKTPAKRKRPPRKGGR
jgi:5-methylcytosine-specific restriction endonuclease McrA